MNIPYLIKCGCGWENSHSTQRTSADIYLNCTAMFVWDQYLYKQWKKNSAAKWSFKFLFWGEIQSVSELSPLQDGCMRSLHADSKTLNYLDLDERNKVLQCQTLTFMQSVILLAGHHSGGKQNTTCQLKSGKTLFRTSWVMFRWLL